MSESHDWPPTDDDVTRERERNTQPSPELGVAALVLGLSALLTGCLCGFFSLPLAITGVIVGVVGVVQASRNPGRYRGKAMAIAGICTSLMGVVLAYEMTIGAHRASQARAIQAIGQFHMELIGGAMTLYAKDNDGAFPVDLGGLALGNVAASRPAAEDGSRLSNLGDAYYVTGLRSDDDPSWILAYGDPADYDGKGAPLLLVGGTREFVSESELTRRLDAFREAYKADRGAEPVIIPPR